MTGALDGLAAVLIGRANPFGSQAFDMLRREGAVVAAIDFAGDPVAGLSAVSDVAEVDLFIVCAPQGCYQSDKQLMASGDDPLIWATFLPGWIGRIADRLRPSSCIVVVGGPSGHGGWPGWVRSGAAMAAVMQIVKAEAVAFGPRQVRCNVLTVGVTRDLAETIATEGDLTLEAVQRRIPTQEWITTEALENALLFLLHPSSSFVSGEVLPLDGGWSVWGRLHATEPV